MGRPTWNHALIVLLLSAGRRLGLGIAAPSADANAFENRLPGAELLKALHGGGDVIFIRHASTEHDLLAH